MLIRWHGDDDMNSLGLLDAVNVFIKMMVVLMIVMGDDRLGVHRGICGWMILFYGGVKQRDGGYLPIILTECAAMNLILSCHRPGQPQP